MMLASRFASGIRAAWLLAALSVVSQLVAAQDATLRIGYVDMQRLIDNAPQVVAARARLEREFAVGDAQLKTDSARLDSLEERLRRERGSSPADQVAALESEADALRRSIERTRERLRSELQQRIEQELDRAWPGIEAAVADYARSVGYDLVLSSPVVYASGRIDITDRVLDRLRQKNNSTLP